jgi:hypothetical protein
MSDYPNKGIDKAHRDAKRVEAEHRQTLRDNRTPVEQLAVLEDRGHGHCKEAAKLREMIEAAA